MSHDTLVHRAVRPLVRAIAPTGVTPNQLTTLRLLTGLAAGAALSRGTLLWSDLGAASLLLSLLLDRADGELARFTGKMSGAGYRYDLACDCIATVASFLGLGFGAKSALGGWGPISGAIGGVSTVVVFFELNVVKIAPAKRTFPARPARVDPDDAMFALPVLIWTGLTPLALALAATLTPAVAVILALLGWRQARRTA